VEPLILSSARYRGSRHCGARDYSDRDPARQPRRTSPRYDRLWASFPATYVASTARSSPMIIWTNSASSRSRQ